MWWYIWFCVLGVWISFIGFVGCWFGLCFVLVCFCLLVLLVLFVDFVVVCLSCCDFSLFVGAFCLLVGLGVLVVVVCFCVLNVVC